jgi:tetratricopeptide (TPR) repeat protein
MSIESLKEQARRHEQEEEWARALGLYLQAIDEAAKEEQPDISLYNRAGDIQTRMGNLDGAVLHYEQAIELYLEADLPNNAIAVCKKVLRNLPQRTGMFLRMGQIRASQGFLTDARQNFLTYAEQMQRAGEMEEAFRALREFADSAPDDLEVRMTLASQLDGLGRATEAVEQYKAAHARLVISGESEQATQVAERILELDPSADLSAPAASSSDEDGFFIEATSLDGESGLAEVAPPVGSDVSLEGIEELEVETFEVFGSESEEDEEDAPASLGVPEDLPAGSESWDELPPEEPVPFLHAAPSDGDLDAGIDALGQVAEMEEESVVDAFVFDEEMDEEEDDEDGGEGMEDLPFLSFGDEDLEEEDGGASAEEEPVALWGEDEADELTEGPDDEEAPGIQEDPRLGEAVAVGTADQDDDDEDEAWETGFLDVEPEEAGVVEAWDAVLVVEEESAPASELDRLTARVEASPDDGDAHLSLARHHVSSGALQHARPHLVQAHDLFVASGRIDSALEAARLLVASEPDELAHHQRVVEVAARAPDRTALVTAMLALAGALARTGDVGKAKVSYEQVLTLHPGHEAAMEGLAALTPVESPPVPSPAPLAPPPSTPAPPPPPPSRPAAPASDDYIDLGSLILDDQPERTTRWFVPAEEPSGDDEADFAKMLGQFKAKVAEHLAGDDATAHYDLGAAYREMGLYQEAIAEFQQSLRADPRNLGTFEMLGQCFLDEGQPEVAIRTLNRALGLGFDVEDDLLGIYYYIGKAHEGLGNSEMAREFYEKVFSLDINFKDVTERLRALR